MLGSLALLPAASWAQQHFPLRAGEWAMTSPQMPSTTFLYCMNDALWQKALTQNPVCTIQDLTMGATGASYSLNCPMKSFQMRGPVTLTFDGTEHMTGKGVFEMTMNGKTSTMTSITDFHWKGAACSANDMNMRPAHTN